MGLISDAAVSRGDVARHQARQEREIAAVRTARRAEATSVGAEGMRFHSGGGITIEDGGGITVEDGGALSARYPSGRGAAWFGPTVTADGGENGHGLLVQADNDSGTSSGGSDILRAIQRPDGYRYVIAGQGLGPDGAGSIDFFAVEADSIAINGRNGGGYQLNVEGNVLGEAVGSIQWLSDDAVAIGGDAGTFMQPEENLVDSANMHMDPTTGRVTYVSSSSERVKRDIQDLDIDPAAVLAMRARSWLPGATVRTCPPWLHEQHETEADCHDGETIDPPEDSRRVVGFVAEELDQIGLGDFVVYDDAGLPSSIAYDRLTAALVPLLQTQQAQIDALTARLDALEHPEEA